MKKNFRIVTLILACLLLIGAAVGISVCADEAPTVQIKYRNLAYEAAPQLVYYVDAQNVAEGDTVKVLFYETEPAAVSLETAAYASDSFGTLSVAGVDYAAFASGEIAPKNLRLAIWAVPAVVNADGEIVASGKAVKYSVFDYALDRFNMSPTEDQVALYTAVLDFGGAVQEVLYEQGKYTDADLEKAGGYANAYYGVRQDVLYDGKTVETGDVTYYKKGETVTLTATASYNTYGIFRGFLNEDGELVKEGAYVKADVLTSKPGVAVYKSEYTITGSIINTYENYITDGSADDVNVKFKGKKNADLHEKTGIWSVNAETFGKEKTDAKYARIDKEAANPDNQVFTMGATTEAGGNSYAWALEEVVVDASKYIFQTDFKWNGASTSTEPCYIRFDSSSIGSDPCNIWYFKLKDGGSGTSIYTLEQLDGKAWKATLQKGEWYTLRFEIIPLSTTHYNLAVYVNGEVVHYEENRVPNHQHTTAINEVNKIIGFRIFNRSATNYNVEMDNTYMGVEKEYTYERGSGEYFNDETKIGTKYSYDGLADVTNDNALIHATTSAEKIISAKDNSLYYEAKDPSSGFGIEYDGEKKSGNTYVLETDVYFGGGKTNQYLNQLAWFGLTGAESASKVNHFLSLAFNYVGRDGEVTKISLRNFGANKHLAYLDIGKWYNLRFVYTVNNTLNADGTVAENGYSGNVELYINNEFVTSFTTGGYTATGYPSGAASNEKLTNVGFEFRSTQWCGVSDFQAQFDNTFIGVYDVTAPEAE